MKIKSKFTIRSEQNRRAIDNSPTRFPMKLAKGEVVLRDRRVNPDRRHPGLQTHELQMSAEEFDCLFEAYQRHK